MLHLRPSIIPILCNSLLLATFSFLLQYHTFVSATVTSKHPNCCSLSASELTAMRGKDPDCPAKSLWLSLSMKCQLCPVGRCRIGNTCYCPSSFLSRPSFHNECKFYFGAPWPKSLGRPDVFNRACEADPPIATESAISCCALPRSSLLALKGLSMLCPTGGYIWSVPKTCHTCPAATCRVGKADCHCPGDFLEDKILQEACRTGFGAPWPHSIGKQDREWGTCGQLLAPVINEPNGSISVLEPSGITSSSTSNVTPSPTPMQDGGDEQTSNPGSSTGPSTAPGAVPSSTSNSASDTTGSSTPMTVPNTAPKNSESPTSNTASDTGPSNEPDSATSATSAGALGESGETITGSTNATLPGSSSEQREATPSPTSPSEFDQRGLVTLEIVGIAAGVVSAVMAVLGAMQWIRWKKANAANANSNEMSEAEIGMIFYNPRN